MYPAATNYNHSVQLDRMERILLSIDRRLEALESNNSGTQTGSKAPENPVSISSVSSLPKQPANEVGSRNRHPELPDDRNPKPDCRICQGVGLVKCKSCRGRGGEINCDSCNGNGRSHFDKRKSCTFCNGTGRTNCSCYIVEGEELCQCTMTMKEKQVQEKLEGVVTGIAEQSLSTGIGMLQQSHGAMQNSGGMFSDFSSGFGFK